MKTCRTCFWCTPKVGKPFHTFQWGACYQSGRKVMANMTACQIHKDRSNTVALKSTTQRRNRYKDKDGNVIEGMTLPEVLNKQVTILAKREYRWGKYEGLAVKVQGSNDKLAIVEITAQTPIKALNNRQMPKPPYRAKFVQKTSSNNRDYYTVELLDQPQPTPDNADENGILPF